MRRTWPIIGVKNVPASAAWYRQLLGLGPRNPDGHPDFEQIRDDDEDETVLVVLHEWGAHDEGPPLRAPSAVEQGNGVLLSFLVRDFDRCLERARGLQATFQEEPEYPDDWFRSFVLRDPDGHYIGIYSMEDIESLRARSGE